MKLPLLAVVRGGLANAQIQFYLTALVQNLKRVVILILYLLKFIIKMVQVVSRTLCSYNWCVDEPYKNESRSINSHPQTAYTLVPE